MQFGIINAGRGGKMVPRLRELCRQSRAEVVSQSSNKTHQTWGPPSNRALYIWVLETASIYNILTPSSFDHNSMPGSSLT